MSLAFYIIAIVVFGLVAANKNVGDLVGLRLFAVGMIFCCLAWMSPTLAGFHWPTRTIVKEE